MICYDYINEYIREVIPKTGGILDELEGYAKRQHVPIVHPEVAKLLTVLVKIKKPKRILEIGTAIGYSSITMARVLEPEGKIDTIEKDRDMVELAKYNIERANLGNTINVVQGDAKEVLKDIDNLYDMVFIDAAKGQYLEFLRRVVDKLNKEAIIVSDNVLYKGMVANDKLLVKSKKTLVRRLREYLAYICSSDMFETSVIPIGDGVALSYVNFSKKRE